MAAASEGALEFRSYPDDAWYSVTVAAEGAAGELLRVKFAGFPDDNDAVFHRDDFADPKRVDDFAARFRPVSLQLQDSQCAHVTTGLLVCASHHFRLDDVRFYDALVDGVDRADHSFANGEEECLCTFILSWLHGPNAGNLTAESIAQICRVQFRAEMDPIVASFVKKARERFESPKSNFIRAGDLARRGKSEAPNDHEEIPRLRIAHKLSFSHHIKQETRRIKWSLSDTLSSKWTFAYPCERNEQDNDVGGVGNHFLIVIENVEKDLTPLAIIEFIRQEVSVSSQAFILPSLPWEVCTRGNVLLDSKRKFQKVCDFLENPDQMVVSSLGRPWVMTEKMPVHDTLQASVETFTLISQNILETKNDGRTSGLKIVHSGTDQYRVAKQLSNLYKEFSDHQQRLQKRLIVEEGTIWMKHNAERRVRI